jgi:phosphomannomutase / phosphoglucomutase
MDKKKLFGTSGIRGSAEELFTPQFSYDIGRTFVEFLKSKGIETDLAVGMDPRTSSPRIKKDLFKGLATMGMQLYDEGVTPIPSMNWLVKNTNVKAAIMITGSHIAADLNGVKFYAHNEEISEEDEREIEKIYWQIKDKDKQSLSFHDKVPNEEAVVKIETRALELYRDLLLSLSLKKYPDWKIAVDAANGAQSVLMPNLLQAQGVRIIEVNCDIQEPFIARDTDTGDKAGIEKLQEVVKKEKCDFGIAYDGDGDRVIFIDENGEFVQGEYSCCLIAKESDSDVIVTTVAASQVVDKIEKKIIRTKVGSPYVVGKMKETKASFGFEPNGGAISAEIQYTRDGGTMTMKLINLFAKFVASSPSGRDKFSDMIATLPRFYMERTKVDYPWELQQTILDEAEKKFGTGKVDKTDGLKIWIDDVTWMLFRSSQNAPEFRVFAESDSKEKSQKMLKDGIDFVEDIIKKHK